MKWPKKEARPEHLHDLGGCLVYNYSLCNQSVCLEGFCREGPLNTPVEKACRAPEPMPEFV